MREIRTSGSMSGDGKRDQQRRRRPEHPRPSSTLPKWRGEVRERAVITAFRLPAVLTVLFKYASLLKKWGARRPVPCPDSPLTHFASPRG